MPHAACLQLLKTVKREPPPAVNQHTSTIYQIQPSPDGKMFATCSADKVRFRVLGC